MIIVIIWMYDGEMNVMALKRLKLHKNGKGIPGESKVVSGASNSKAANQINVTQLDNGKSAKVVELRDNSEIMSKLEAMGIIPGAIITKKSAILSKGPIILEKEHMQFAIGYDLAQKIIVEPVNLEIGSGL